MRLSLRLLPPLLLVLGLLDLFVVVAHSASYAPLGRDQGIFQFTAFATAAGDRLYTDLREVNGPLTHLVHRLFLWLGGADVHVFRSLDLLVSGLVYAGIGGLVPRMLDARGERPPALISAAVALVLLGAQYLGYLGWDLAQRESFATWFVLIGVAVSALPHRGVGAPALAGAAVTVACFGKPTMGAYVPLLALAVAVQAPRVKRLLAFAAGALGSCALVLLATQIWLGDPWRGLRLTLIEAPALYAELFRRGVLETLTLPWLSTPMTIGAAASVLALVALSLRWWPPRFVGLALAPLAGIVALAVQGKGYPYHAHPITAAAWFCLVIVVFQLHARALAIASPGARPAAVVLALLTLALVFHGRWALGRSPHYFRRDVAWAARAGADERSAARLAHAEDHDFHPRAMAEAAAWLDAHTAETDRVQIYGTDPLVLFWARRRSATPYLYEYDLDVGHALAGAIARRGEQHPKTEAIRAMGVRHGADALARLSRAPAAAFVLFDGSPFMTQPSAIEDLQSAQPELAAWLRAHYRLAATFGTSVHVWERVPPPPSLGGAP